MKSIKGHLAGAGKHIASRTAPETTVRIGPTMAIPAVLRSLGADPGEVLAELGLDLQLFDDPDNRISYAARGRLLAHCAARTGCRHFGLLVGQQAGLQSLGLVGLVAKYSPDVGTALRNFVRHSHLHVRGAAPTLELDGDSAMLGFETYEPVLEATDQIAAGAVAVLFNVLRALCGPEWKPVEVRFAHRKPGDVGPFRRFFHAPLHFDAEQNAVAFSARWLDRRLPGADPELCRLLEKQIGEVERRNGDDFPEQVRRALRTALVTGHAKAEQVAALFSMHSRTLNRRLNAYGTGFQELVDEGRFEIARQMLANSTMEVRQVAVALDYADASAFTRAFRRWSGTTPAQWRATRNRGARRAPGTPTSRT